MAATPLPSPPSLRPSPLSSISTAPQLTFPKEQACQWYQPINKTRPKPSYQGWVKRSIVKDFFNDIVLLVEYHSCKITGLSILARFLMVLRWFGLVFFFRSINCNSQKKNLKLYCLKNSNSLHRTDICQAIYPLRNAWYCNESWQPINRKWQSAGYISQLS